MHPYYQDDHCTIYHGDALSLGGTWNVADVLITDPPYGIRWSRGEGFPRSPRAHAGIANDATTDVRDAILAEWGRDRPAIVFGSVYLGPPPATRHVLIYKKPTDAGIIGALLGHRRDVEAIYLLGTAWPRTKATASSVLTTAERSVGNPSSPAGRTGHPHTKPLDLMRYLVSLTPADAVIADPFAGSGTTLRAAKDLGRRAIGIELEERYCEVAAQRLAQEALAL